MYLLEAKKRAEQEHRDEKAREARHRAAAIAKQQKQQQQQQDGAAKPKESRAALEAQQALQEEQKKAREIAAAEEAQLKEAIRRSKEDQGGRSAPPSARHEDRAGQRRDLVVSPVPKAAAASSAPAPVKPTARSAGPPSGAWQDAEVTCKYVGTFEVGTGKIDKAMVKTGIRSMKVQHLRKRFHHQDHVPSARPAILFICLEGVKVIDASSQKVAMAHALIRIAMSSADVENSLFGFVAKNPGDKRYFCHVFVLRKQRHAEEVQAIMSKAFRLAFSEDRTQKASKPSSSAPTSAAAASSAPAPAAAAAPDAAQRQRDWARNNPLQVPKQQQRRIGSDSAPPPLSPPPAVAAAASAAAFSQAPASSRAMPRSTSGSAFAAAPTSAASADATNDHDGAAWFQAGIPREIAMELLALSDDGAFIVRDSQSQPGNFALTMRGNSLMHHFIIRSTPRGLVLGLDEDGQPPFPTLSELINYYTRTKGILPCTLDLDHENKLCTEDAQMTGDLDSFVDNDYQSLKSLGLH